MSACDCSVSLCSTLPSCFTNRPNPSCPPAPPLTCRLPSTPSSRASRDCKCPRDSLLLFFLFFWPRHLSRIGGRRSRHGRLCCFSKTAVIFSPSFFSSFFHSLIQTHGDDFTLRTPTRHSACLLLLGSVAVHISDVDALPQQGRC